MTKDGGDDGMPELDDISKIGKKVWTRPSQKTIKTQNHLTRPPRLKTRPSHKTITQDHITRPSHMAITQDHQDLRQDHRRC